MNNEKWIVQSYYGGERLVDECSETPYSVVLPEGGSFPEDIICEVWGTERDDIETANAICAAHNIGKLRSREDRIIEIWNKQYAFGLSREQIVKFANDIIAEKFE